MGYLLLALTIIIGLFAEGAGTWVRANAPSLNAPPAYAVQPWLAYKSAVQVYVEQHPGVSGSLDLDTLGLQGQTAALAQAGNSIIATPGQTTVVTWMAMPANAQADTLSLSDGDHSIGLSNGTSWTSPWFGDMGALPLMVPAGDIVSVVILSGTGF
ncbi:type IV pilus biogenesis protein PilM [Acetobacter vaccinii]|uniref:Uncharacterized protein n=1 Tax=Acetobacter vaccinii TaxID=2592655 RepID=A0A5C1YUL2_9PROT|nr:hypothetical protein [Acetobacter vaccinii]QEO18742.1 hypothetical protein FLP30_12675 [Acetobacter vaccinii]